MKTFDDYPSLNETVVSNPDIVLITDTRVYVDFDYPLDRTTRLARAHYQTLLMREQMINVQLTEDTIIASIDDYYHGTLGPMYAEHKIPHYKSLDEYLKFLEGELQ